MKPKPILVVEDDRDIRDNLQEILESEGYTVLLAADGKAALTLLRSTELKPALILLDLMMPVMDGRAFLREAQASADLSEIPVVIISAGTEEIEARVAGFMRKPIDLDEVLAMAAKYTK